MTITNFRPARSVICPAAKVMIRLAAALIVTSEAVCVRGRFSLSLAYTIKKGQIMLAPIVLKSMPQKSSQN